MPLILDPDRLPPALLARVADELRSDLEETLRMADAPRARVVDPAGVRAAADLLRAVLARLDRPGERDAATRGAEINLAYAAMVAAIDLVKSHTEMPRVPPPRPRTTPTA